jgi:hypothetical protein
MRSTNYSIHYDLVPTQRGVTLRIWETAPLDKEKCLYKLQYKQVAPDTAWQLLNQHLKALGVEITSAQFQPEGGEIQILPEMTWA